MDDTKAAVTMPVEELAKLVKHSEHALFFFNLPRRNGQFHRCLRLQILDAVPGNEEIRFEIQEDDRVVQMTTHSVEALFSLLPRLTKFLAEAQPEQVP